MRILVTGANGFVGHFVTRELQRHGHDPILHGIADMPVTFDICDAAAVDQAIRELKPEGCIHLAGIAFVPRSWEKPDETLNINVGGTVHLLEAFRKYVPDSRFLFICSSQIYGGKPRSAPITEDSVTDPENIYAVAKLAADQITLLYHARYGLHAMSVRPGNHIGPGQSKDFVAPSFAQQVRDIAEGRKPPRLMVGNLESQREFTDVRDVARGYRLLMECGHAGQAYNLSAGHFSTIGGVLDQFCTLAGVAPERVVDPTRYRPTDTQPPLDCTKLRHDTGWEPTLSLADSLRDVYADTK